MTEAGPIRAGALPLWAVTPQTRDALLRWVRPATWTIFAMVTLAGTWLRTWPEAWLYAPFVVSVLAFGLPHGAVDHLVVLRVFRRRATMLRLVAVCAAYLLAAASFLAVWYAAPALAALAFIGMTWFHWGQGDLYFLLTAAPANEVHLRTRLARVAALALRGGLPMLVPLLAAPDAYATVAASFAALFDADASARLYAALVGFDTSAGWLLFAAIVVAYATGTALTLRRAGAWASGTRRSWSLDLFEVVLLSAFFATVPPVFAVGLYFCLWHAVRHLIRLLPLGPETHDTAQALPRQQLPSAARRLSFEALPLTLAALALLASLYAFTPNPPATLAAWAALYLVLISALTFPHVLVVCAMDARQGLWYPAPPTPVHRSWDSRPASPASSTPS